MGGCLPARMPSRDTVRRWQREHGAFRERYVLARDQQADALAEERSTSPRHVDTDSMTVCRLQSDTIKWLVAKIAPRRYGDKVLPDATVRVSIGDAIEKGRERVRRLREG